jgi:UDP-N-acetylmuramoylalanine--D-glutamate ligase
MELAGQSVLVLGLGVSGRSAARFCDERGARVVVADERARHEIEGLDTLPDTIECRLGTPFPDLELFDLVVPSPGIPAARWAGRARRVWGDLELCYRALSIPIVAVTGTNGKSTVVRLIEAMARAAGLRARAAGNLGLPALELVGQPLDLAILEVSSFQLESVEAFRPRTGVLLNVSPDHLDRHGDLAGYVAAKSRLFARQTTGDSAVLNDDDEIARQLALPRGVERLAFSRRHPVERGAWLDGRNVVLRRGDMQRSLSLDGYPLLGAHNEENVLAAVATLSTVDLDLEAAAHGWMDFHGLPHRSELVAEIDGVQYIDDSKATNVGAAARALEGFAQPIVWIAGGRHKGGDLSSLVDRAAGRVRLALLIGEAAESFERALDGKIENERVDTLTQAVARAAERAHPGDVVLLAPACASFDQFRSFEERGRRFQDAVHALSHETGHAPHRPSSTQEDSP